MQRVQVVKSNDEKNEGDVLLKYSLVIRMDNG
jgi:hypothetical protein